MENPEQRSGRKAHNDKTPPQLGRCLGRRRTARSSVPSATMPLYEIIYLSLADHEVSADELSALKNQVSGKNQLTGISGMLIYHRREFMQLIEGEKDTVIALYEKISRDTRHQQLHLLWEGPIEERNFARWSMACVAMDSLGMAHQEQFASLLASGLHASSRDTTGKKILLRLRDQVLETT